MASAPIALRPNAGGTLGSGAGISKLTTAAPTLDGAGLAYFGLCVAAMGWASAFIVGKLLLGGMTPLAVANC